MKLTEKYRPQTFEDFKGSALVASMLSKMVKEENLPNCLLFSGPRGTGKTSMARILNNLLNDESSTMSYIEVDAASNNGVENIRSLQETIRYSHPGSWRIVVLDEALALDTPIPTPEGWTTVGEIQPGAKVIGSNGIPTEVVRKTAIFEGKDCYKVHFSDGTSMVTSANHKWLARRNETNHKMRVFTTEEMFERGHKFRIPAASAWDLPKANLPVSPYLLGLWLGDGSRSQLHVSGVEADLLHYKARLIQEEGLVTRLRSCLDKSAQRLTFSSPRTQWDDDPTSQHARRFRKGPWMNNKHIPAEFMRGSIQQREALLQGLMDTDGWVGEGGWCTFVGTERLCLDVQELLTTLGIESSFKMVEDERATQGYGKVNFSARSGIMPVSLPRKVERVRQARIGGKCDFRTITRIEPTDSVPTQCIEVAAEDHLFLAGPGGHVTHNCHSLSNSAFNALLKVLEEPPNKTVFILITTKPETIPDTVKSRASTFRFNQMDVATIALRLHDVIKAEALPIRDPKVLIRIAEVSEGSMRGALVLLEQLLMAPEINVEAVNELSGNTVDTKDLIYTMLSGDLQEVEVELANIFSRTGDVDKLLTSLSRTLKEFHKAGLLNNTKFLACMGVVWNMRKLLRGNDEVARTQLEAGMFAMFAQNFWNGEEGETKAISEELTTEALESIVGDG